MPNICWWTITFYNPSKELREYLRDISKNKNASIEEFVCPMLPDIKASTLPNSWSDAWYNWSCKNRGSKWGTYDHYIQEDKDDEIEITFSTAWSPIKDEILEKLSRHCDFIRVLLRRTLNEFFRRKIRSRLRDHWVRGLWRCLFLRWSYLSWMLMY